MPQIFYFSHTKSNKCTDAEIGDNFLQGAGIVLTIMFFILLIYCLIKKDVQEWMEIYFIFYAIVFVLTIFVSLSFYIGSLI